MLRQRKLLLDIIKNNIKFELKDCKMHKNLLYINDKLYILNNLKLRIKFIKNIYNSLLNKHANRLFIYN